MADLTEQYPDPKDPPQRQLVERAAADLQCPKCGHVGFEVTWRLVAKPIGSFSLSGHTMKVSAVEQPYVKCQGCGIEGGSA